MAGESLRPSLAKIDGKGRKRGPDLSVLVETTVVGLFGLVAVATAHEHWLKERQDVMAITGPLNAWIDQLPSKTLKKIEKNLAPTLLVVGFATVLVPDAILEMRIRADQKRYRQAIPQQGPRSSSAGSLGYPSSGGSSPTANGANQPAGPEGGWSSGIPADGPLHSDWNVG